MTVRILQGDCREVLKTLPDESVHCVVTSPPYLGLRDYGHAGQLGLEPTPQEYVERMVEVFSEARRVLRADGTLWLNLGDSYNTDPVGMTNGKRGSTLQGGAQTFDPSRQIRRKPWSALKPKDLCGIPWRVAFALQAAGWYLRQDIIWAKPNPMPESVRDRCTKAHEYIFLLAKSERYYFDPLLEEAVGTPQRRLTTTAEQPGGAARAATGGQNPLCQGGSFTERNKRSVWLVPTEPYRGAHFATFPPALIEPCILAGCPEGGTVLDPFFGAGTTGLVADRHKRHCIGIELNPEYVEMAKRRVTNDAPLFAEVEAR